MPHPIVGSRFRDGTQATDFGTRAKSALFSIKGLTLHPVVAPMYASECRRYAEQCLQLAQVLPPKHRERLLAWADEWRRVAEELEELEPQEDHVQQ
jgi:hypothetical protein